MAEAGISTSGIIVGDTAPEIRTCGGRTVPPGAFAVTYIEQRRRSVLAPVCLIAATSSATTTSSCISATTWCAKASSRLAKAFAGSGANARILLAEVHDPQRFGVAELDERGDVVAPCREACTSAFEPRLVGVYLFDASIHAAVREITPSARGELEITDAIQWLIDQGRAVTARSSPAGGSTPAS